MAGAGREKYLAERDCTLEEINWRDIRTGICNHDHIFTDRTFGGSGEAHDRQKFFQRIFK